MNKIMGFKFRRLSVLLVLVMTSACAIRPIQGNRHGLLDHEGGSRTVSTGSEKGAEPSRHMASVEAGSRALGGITLPGKWQWPLEAVEISSPYGERGAKFHQGIDLRAKVGTHVLAAAAGEVVYVGSKIKGYGRMVVLKHENGFYTVYAHHSKNLVKMGNKVEQGQTIALSGKSGRSHGAHLHFELRRGAQSIDPEYAFNGYFKTSANRKIASKSHLTHDFED
jgi:murein DD-endopeptidase MepM/ murein hydrolase activator NlpD